MLRHGLVALVLCSCITGLALANDDIEVINSGSIDVNTIEGYENTTYDTNYNTGYAPTNYRSESIHSDQLRATRSWDTVGKRRFQVETQFDYQKESDTAASTKQFSFPTQLRYGLVDDLELRVSGNMFTYQDTTGAGSNSGFGDLTVGTKWSIVEGGGLLPSLGVLAELGVPTGNNNVSRNAVIPAGQAIMAWNLPGEFRLDSNIGIDYVEGTATSNGRFARFTYGAAVERDLPLLGERLGAFVEFAGAASLSDSGTAPHLFSTGLDYDITDTMNVNTFGRIGMNDAAPNFQTGLGFGWKL